MFEDSYRRAYDAVSPPQELVADVIAQAREGKSACRKIHTGNRQGRKAAFIAAAAVLCIVTAVPVCAANIPAFYKIVEYLSPELADRLVPIEKSCTSQGITMEVEAVSVEGNEARIIVSLRDAEDSTQDLVHGVMDLYGGYGLSGAAVSSNVGGCHFLTYDETDDKAYFQIDVQAETAFESEKLHFSATSVLCGKYSETRDVDLSEVVYAADKKKVVLSGSGGIPDEKLPESLRHIPATPENPRPHSNVLDLRSVTDCAADDFTTTGIAYMDGVLRVQMCMGDNWKSDRHVQLFLKDSDGNERHSEHSVGWHEDVGDTSYQFYEFWFIGEIDDMSEYSMYGIFHDSGELVEGDWNVTFRLQ